MTESLDLTAEEKAALMARGVRYRARRNHGAGLKPRRDPPGRSKEVGQRTANSQHYGKGRHLVAKLNFGLGQARILCGMPDKQSGSI